MTFRDFKLKYEKKEVTEVKNNTPQDPLLSICIQTFQHQKYLRQCLDSILIQQTNFDFEILIGEDNSLDDTREICLEYARKFPDRIKLFLHSRENQIPIMGEATSNFNAFYNLFSTRGKYVAFCEGDDSWDDSLKLQKQVDFLEANSEYVFSYHKYQEINEEGKPFIDTNATIQPTRDLNANELQKGEVHPLLLTICFRNLFKEIPEEITEVINVDTFLLSLLGKYGGAKYQANIGAANYRKHQGGIWSKRAKRMKFLSKILTFQKLYDYYKTKEDQEISLNFKEKLRNSYKMLLLNLYKEGQIIDALKLHLRFLRV